MTRRGFGFEILAMDDGSSDESAAIVESCSRAMPELLLLRHDCNRGKGAAVRDGFLKARGEFVLLSDADLSTPIEMLDKFLERAGQPDAPDAIIGSRPHRESQIEVRQPWLRRKMGETFNVLLRPLTGLPFRDTQCGFKLFRRKAFLPVFEALTIHGFAFDVEILVRAGRLGLRVAEYPVVWRNDPRSSVHIVRDSWRMLRDVLKIWAWNRGGRKDR
jgi:dolichyl-phosphate beta-glucosyltransferase